jgi:hypothetical protein
MTQEEERYTVSKYWEQFGWCLATVDLYEFNNQWGE